jgi:hypothetical protein
MAQREAFKESEKYVSAYISRSDYRQRVLMKATMDFVAYFIALGDDQATAEDKVGQVSDAVNQWLFPYVLGRTQNLIDAINAIDGVAMPFMDTAAKDFLTQKLTIVTP